MSLDSFLHDVTGLIHVGASVGQERQHYADHGLVVLWVEPIPWVFDELSSNIEPFSNQQAIQCLITDQNNAEYSFNIASNAGMSSSIFDLALHTEVWPSIHYTGTLRLRSKTLPAVLDEHLVDRSKYQALVLDTQGAELLILKGAESILHDFRFIKTEVADFECYRGGCVLSNIETFLALHGFRECAREKFADRAGGGSCYDVVYQLAD